MRLPRAAGPLPATSELGAPSAQPGEAGLRPLGITPLPQPENRTVSTGPPGLASLSLLLRGCCWWPGGQASEVLPRILGGLASQRLLGGGGSGLCPSVLSQSKRRLYEQAS